MRVFPIALIVIGVLLLLRNLGVIPHDIGHTWWPLILIVGGVLAFFRCSCHGKKKCGAGKCCATDNEPDAKA